MFFQLLLINYPKERAESFERESLGKFMIEYDYLNTWESKFKEEKANKSIKTMIKAIAEYYKE